MTDEFSKFDATMKRLILVSHDDIKAKLDKEKNAKKRKRKAKRPSVSVRVSREKN